MSRYSADAFARYVGAQFLTVEKPQTQQRPAITISRQSGAGALTVASLVAQHFEPPLSRRASLSLDGLRS
jgi:hypothetical protein